MKKLLIALLLVTSNAKAQFLTGNELYARLTSRDTPEKIFAAGYVSGVFDTGHGTFHCATGSNVTIGQVSDIAKNYLEQNPEVRNISADLLVTASFARVWPCSLKKKGT